MTWNTNTAILARLETFSEDTAWTSLVEHFERPLTRYARRAGLTPDRVRDVVQESLIAFAEAYRRGKYDRTRGRLSGWLFGIARREVAAARRKAALDPVAIMDSVQERELPDQDSGQEGVWEQEWRRAMIERCMERVRRELDPATWQCFHLQVIEGLATEEVAARLDVPRARVYDCKYRVTRRLRELEREFEDA